MSQDHSHDHHDHLDHHDHPHSHDAAQPLPEALDLAIPESELSPTQLGRRSFLRRAGLLGAAAAGAGVLAGTGTAAADTNRADNQGEQGDQRPSQGDPRGLLWLTGDHHIHTQYSPDAQYLVSEQVARSAQYGLDWMVITDHGGPAHQKFSVERTNPDIVVARSANARTLVFQGLEWNIPSAEHGTVFVAPGKDEVGLLKEFEGTYDGTVTKTSATSAANEKLARDGVAFLGNAVRSGRVNDALMLANHPARRGVDSPHEIRGWRDANPRIAVGMEGAPGHQAAAIPGPGHEKNGRGYYDNAPTSDSFAGYPPESYVTYGGFDWMTSTVGGLWDALLAEGKPWWISANSDSHKVYLDTRRNVTDTGSGGNNANTPYDAAGNTYNTTGRYPDPVDTGKPIATYGDFWPGFYSNTVVGATDFSYGAVMAGIRAGRMYVTHGGLVGAVSVRLVGGDGAPATLGGTLMSNRGNAVELQVDVALADRPNFHGDVPQLKKVDVIVGSITGPATNADTFDAPTTRVVKTFEVPAKVSGGVYQIRYRIKGGKDPFYVRLRGSDGKRTAVGLRGANVDPSGPKVDAIGNADPWQDLWFYTNPIFVLPKK